MTLAELNQHAAHLAVCVYMPVFKGSRYPVPFSSLVVQIFSCWYQRPRHEEQSIKCILRIRKECFIYKEHFFIAVIGLKVSQGRRFQAPR